MHIELQDIHKYYGPVKANNGINLKVTPGQIHGILGENGAGKSTILRALSGLVPLAPIILTTDPSSTSTETSFNAIECPRCTVMCLISSIFTTKVSTDYIFVFPHIFG